MLTAPSSASSALESAAVPADARGWLVTFVVAGLASVIVSSLVTVPAIRGVVTGAASITQLVAFSKVWFPAAHRA